ncbi:MAG: PHP domain-containing protein [Saprospiraceae bacterium]|nr:PHP domain-containing protein [Saprospiraceae bacterium]
MIKIISVCFGLSILAFSDVFVSSQLVLTEQLHHLRIGREREWTEFPEKQEATHLELKFEGRDNRSEQTIRLRQQDVKQAWRLELNDKELGQLAVDENDMVIYFGVPAGLLTDGENVLRIDQVQRSQMVPDDIRVGEIVLDQRPRSEVLAEATVQIDVVDEQSQQPLPARITIVNQDGALQSTNMLSNDHLAVRPGIVFTSTGKASFGLPAGTSTIFAGRGFEYSLAQVEISVNVGEKVVQKMRIRREVSTDGYVACDTHVHTRTHSGHGDATVDERMITLAAEGIELPVATDHNVHIDHNEFARKMKVRKYFTPVIGNEVTTGIGHFNAFPAGEGSMIPNYQLTDWGSILNSIYRTPNVKVTILNHARDLHAGTTPFGTRLHNAVVGENLEGWPITFNGFEVVNSSATQTDVLQLFQDWMGLLNRGYLITPVGSSDSHDVGRHFVGQGRTYIRCHDSDPGNIDVDMAVSNFLGGRVMVSYGLLAELTVAGKYKSGELAQTPDETIELSVRVLGPHWTNATKLNLYANGQLIIEQDLLTDQVDTMQPGLKWSGKWRLPKPKHDVHLVAIALGLGIDGLYWKTAKPYQPASPEWKAQVVGCSGAIWLDVDGDGRRTSAHQYAIRAVDRSSGDLAALLEILADYDEAVAAQAAHL